MHTPVEVTDAAVAQVAAFGVDGTVAIGGGSTIGLGKAIAVRTDPYRSARTPFRNWQTSGVKSDNLSQPTCFRLGTRHIQNQDDVSPLQGPPKGETIR
jgi:alcohol dehydrogenase class IV